MGFFYSESATKSDKTKTKKIPVNSARDLQCKVCPREKFKIFSPKMDPIGSENPSIYILIDQPSKDDDANGEPLYGKAGDIIFEHFPDNWQEFVRINYIVRCHGSSSANAIEFVCCEKFLQEDIEKTKPKLIIGLGSTVLGNFFKASKIDVWRNRFIPIKIGSHTSWFFPTFSPESVLSKRREDKNTKQKTVKTEYDHSFKLDILRVLKEYRNLPEAKVYETDLDKGIEFTTGNRSDKELKKVLIWLGEASTWGPHALDIETNGLRPYTEDPLILSIAIGTFDKTYSFPIQYPGCWTKEQLKVLMVAVKEYLLHSDTKFCHNAQFEQEWLSYPKFFGPEVLRNTPWGCTQAQAYTMDERRGMLSLDILCKINFGISLKAMSNLDRANLIKAPIDQVLKYNALDTKWTDLLAQVQTKRLKKEKKLLKVYNQLIKSIPTLAKAQQVGLVVDYDLRDTLDKEVTEEIKEVTEEIRKFPEVHAYERRNGRLNFGSPQELLQFFKAGLLLDEELKDKTGKHSTGEEVIRNLDKTKFPFAPKILQLRALVKKYGTYIEPLVSHAYPSDGRVHTNFNLYETRTGRLCVAKGTKIEVVRDLSKYPDGINVEDVQSGDLVYTFDENKKLTLKKVIWSGKTGTKKVLRIHWRGQGRHHTGHLDITCNHPLRLTSGEYIRADELRPYDRVLSLTRGSLEITPSIKRNYGTHRKSNFYYTGNKKIISDHKFIYETLNSPVPEGFVIHHIDHNGLNNLPSNFEILSKEDHLRHHSLYEWKFENNRLKRLEAARYPRIVKKGQEHWNWIPLSKYQCLRLIAKCKGNFTWVKEVDPGTFLRKCELYNIDYKHISRRYTKQGVYCGKSKTFNLVNSIGPTKTCKLFNADYTKFKLLLKDYNLENTRRFSEFLKLKKEKFTALKILAKAKGNPSKTPYDYYSFARALKNHNIDWKLVKHRYDRNGKYFPSTIQNNHIITKIEWLDELVDVYDIGVEDTHNFIANGLCVSNSSNNPNMQNWPNRRGKELRRLIIAPKDSWIVASDYGQIEARILGVASQDPVYCDAMWNNYDIHLEWAERISKAYPDVIGGRANLGNEEKLKKFRKEVKNQWTFPAFYGSSPYSIARAIKIPTDTVLQLFGQFWKMFAGVKKWQKRVTYFYDQNGYVETLTGRRRYGPLTFNEYINSPIQGTASDICVNAMNHLSEAGINVIMNIHDDVTSYIKDEDLEQTIEVIAEIMCKSAYELIPFLNVPIAIEISAGTNWCDQEEVGTYFSTEFMKVDKKLHNPEEFMAL